MTRRGQEAAPAAALTPEEFHAMLLARLREAGSARKLAAQLGIHPATISEVIRLRVGPGPTLYLALGYRKIVTYEPRRQEAPKSSASPSCATSRDANSIGRGTAVHDKLT